MESPKVTITKLDHNGNRVLGYGGQVVFRDDQVIVARCPWTSPEPFDLGPFCLERGDIFLEHYYLTEWFNIFEIHDSSGNLKGWYCNVTKPVELDEDEIRWTDLALDLLVLPDGEQTLLDEEEFERLQPSPEVRGRAEDALRTLRRWLAEGHPPFAVRDKRLGGS
jgi:hypothetical protein